MGKIFTDLAKKYLGVLAEKLEPQTGINRYFYALLVLNEEGQKQLTQQRLAELLSIDKVTTVRIIDYLSKKGLVKRQVNSTDRRAHLLVLTPKAIRMIPEIQKAYAEIEFLLFEGMEERKKKELKEFLMQMQQKLCTLPSQKIRVKLLNTKKED